MTPPQPRHPVSRGPLPPALRASRTERGPLAYVVAALAVGFALSATACQDSSTGSEPSPIGSYSLVLLGGTQLPFLVSQTSQQRLDIVAGTLDVREGGTCTQAFGLRRTFTDSVVAAAQTNECTWSRTGNTLVMDRDDGYRATAQIMGTELHMVGSDNRSYRYER